MLKRKIEDALIAWKNKPGHKPLVIIGTRQCGKTFVAQHFAKVFLLFLGVLAAGVLGARERQYAYISMSVGDGLSQPNVTALSGDRRGSLWVGTKNGLNRFDRMEIQVFRSRIEDPATLPDNRINALSEGPDGQLWVLCDYGLVRYRPEQDRFETLISDVAFCVLPLEEEVYVGSSARVLHCTSEGKVLDPLSPFPARGNDRGYDILRMVSLPSGELLLGTRSNGLFRYKPGQPAILFAPSAGYGLIGLYLTSDGTVCAAYHGGGLRQYAPDGKLLREYTTTNSALSSDYIQDFAEYGGELWMATDGGGICILPPGGEGILCLRHQPEQDDSLPSNSITTLHVDGSGALWAGTVKNGFFQIRESHIKSLQGNQRGLRDNAVTSLFRDSDRQLWVGTDGGGVHRFHPESGRFEQLKGSVGKILSIAEYDKGRLLVSMYQEGYFLLDKRSGSKTPFLLADEIITRRGRFTTSLQRALQLPWGSLCFIGGPSRTWNPRSRLLQPLLMESGETAPDGLQMAYANENGALLYKDNHVFLLRRHDERLQLLFSAGLHENITALAADGAGTIWVGTTRNLGRYQVEQGTYVPLQTQLFDDVSALECSPDGNVWICAQNHLYTYLPREARMVSWSESDGFRPNDIKMLYQNAPDPDFIYMGGSEGLVQIDRGTPVPQAGHPEIFLERLEAGGRTLPFPRLEVKLPWRKRQLSASFLVKDEDPFLKKILRYELRGALSWTIDSDQPRLTLSALESGDYELWVSCLTKGGTFSKPSKKLVFTVLPPWYRSWWFALLCMLLFMLGFGLLQRQMLHNEEVANKSSMAHFLEEMLQDGDGQELPQPTQAADSAFRTQLDNLIRENLSNPELGVRFLTDRLPLSRSALYAKVKDVTGMGVKDYINRMRIERSVELLLHTDKNINEIAYEVGFTYPRYFSTSFKLLKGVTPTHFKKENKG